MPRSRGCPRHGAGSTGCRRGRLLLNPMSLRRRGTAAPVPRVSSRSGRILTRNQVPTPRVLSGIERPQHQVDDVRSELRPEGELGLERRVSSPRCSTRTLRHYGPGDRFQEVLVQLTPGDQTQPGRTPPSRRPAGQRSRTSSPMISAAANEPRRHPLPRALPGSRSSPSAAAVGTGLTGHRPRSAARGAASAASLSSKSGSSSNNSQAAALSLVGSTRSGAAVSGSAASIRSRCGAWVGPQSQRSSVTPSNPFLRACVLELSPRSSPARPDGHRCHERRSASRASSTPSVNRTRAG